MVHFEINQTTTFGTSVFLLGDHPLLGGGDVTQALKLVPVPYPTWYVDVDLPAGTTVNYRFLTRQDSVAQLGNTANATYISPSPISHTVPGSSGTTTGTIRYYSGIENPVLERYDGTGYVSFPFVREGDGRVPGESLWKTTVTGLPPNSDWEFRVRIGTASYDVPSYGPRYKTSLATLWLQDGDLFNYAPPATVSAPTVVKIPSFTGSLSTRALYVYKPRGYTQNTAKNYPVLYMHDGQNCFQAYAGDSSFGSWKADDVASLLIRQGRMRECLIVGVSHGGSARIPEYLPPYSSYNSETGRADQTANYYINSVAPYIDTNYRALTGRDDTATCGSSMGGLFSTYLGWEYPQFAKHHASVSSAFWITENAGGDIETISRLAEPPRRDIRLWLDSGTNNDGTWDTWSARDAMLQNDYAVGPDMQHYIAIGAGHNEASWNARLDKVFLFLLPISQEITTTNSSFQEGWMIQ